MTQTVHYIAIRKADVNIGQPILYDIYDGDRKLLLKKGFVVETMSELEKLAEKGLYRDSRRLESGGATKKDGAGGVGENGKKEPAAEHVVLLDEIKLGIGDTFQVQMQAEQAESRYYVKLIGYLKGKSVLVTAPEIDGNLCFVREGQTFIVRFFSGKNAYAFTASVIRASTIPFPHLCLSYPPQVRGLVVRSSDRVGVRLICSVTIPDGLKTATVAGVITNISVGGALLVTKMPLGRKGSIISVKFRMQIRDIESFLTVDATICAILKGDPGAPEGEHQHGIQFADLANEDAIALTAFVYQKLVANLAN